MRHFARLKNRLFPYLFAAAQDANSRGWPAMRAMFVEFPDDPTCRYLDRQYMLGPSLLVAPVFRQDDTAEYYLPEGKWTNLLSNKVVRGGRWISEKLDFFHVPLFARQNSIIAMSGNEEQSAWSLRDELILNLCQIADGADFEIRVAASDGKSSAQFHCAREGGKITLKGNGRAKTVHLLLRSIRKASGIANGKMLRELPEGALLEWKDSSKPVTFSVSD